MSFSIIAFDKEEGLFGSAVASNLIAIGGIIPVYRKAVGLVHAQGQVFPKGAESILDFLQKGIPISQSIDLTLTADENSPQRQYLACDHGGNFEAYSGDACNPIYETIISKNCVVGGNILNHSDIVGKMVETYEVNSQLPMAERLLLSLERGESIGGDERGTKSASLKIYSDVHPHSNKRLPDLRVDSHRTPVTELRNLYNEFNANGPRTFMY